MSIKQTYKKDWYNHLILTDKKSELKSSWPKFDSGKAKVHAMGEIGERAVARRLWELIRGHNDEPIDMGFTLEYLNLKATPLTTQQLVEMKMMSKDDEKEIQLAGIDIIIIPESWIDERKRISKGYALNNPDLCVQVKLQPWAVNYNGITSEIGTDVNYHYSKWYEGQPLEPGGVNKTTAKWTVYIVCGGTFLLIETAKLRKLTYENKPKYIGTDWKTRTREGKVIHKCAVGTYLSFDTLFKTGVAQPISLSGVFRNYFSQIHNAGSNVNPETDSWKLFVQDWPVKTFMNFVEGGLSSVDENLIRGNKE